MLEKKLSHTEYLEQMNRLIELGYSPSSFVEDFTARRLATQIGKKPKRELPDLPEGTILISNPELKLD